MKLIETVEQPNRIYGETVHASLIKVTDYIAPHHAAFIEASPFVALMVPGRQGTQDLVVTKCLTEFDTVRVPA